MRWHVFILWLLFLVRGSFYCAMLPLWEGWDEYAHFAWLQHWIDHGTLPGFHDPVSREIDESMRLAPLAGELRWIGPPYQTHSQWWKLPAAERTERMRRLANLPPAFAHQPAEHPFDFYEAQQPPLYYWGLSVPLRLLRQWPLEARVKAVRRISMALASLAIPLTWLAARFILTDDALALLCAALLAVAPGFVIDVSRVANDSLAIPLVAALFLLLVRPGKGLLASGITLGAALLAKAYLLALIPGLALLWWRQKRRLALTVLIAFLIAGWWYVRNLMLGYSLSGWMLRADAAQVLKAAAFRINWFSAAHVIAKSFLWFGGWSFLTMKSWIYVTFELAALLAVALAFRRRNLRIPAVLTGTYLLAMAWGVAVYAVAQNVPNLPGWYLWPMGSMISVILVAGLRRYAVGLVAALAALDLYGAAALQTPFYAGLVERNKAAAGQFFTALSRLGIPLPLALAWVAATLAIVAIAVMTDYSLEKPHGPQR